MNRRTWPALMLAVLLSGLLAACSNAGSPASEDSNSSEETGSNSQTNQGSGMGMGSGMGQGSGMGGMMARHMATIPAEYSGLTSPVAADAASVARGSEIYAANCAACHGDGGMGDGPAGAALDPLPAPIAHTSQMMGDDYLFWRISEGGFTAPFNSTMPSWKAALDEDARWDVINYVRALGRGEAAPGSSMGGMMYDAEAEAAQQAEMLAEAVSQGVISQEEADLFESVHAALENLNMGGPMQGNMGMMMSRQLQILVDENLFSWDEANAFAEIHERLIEAGLME